MSILVGVDGSPESRNALRWAAGEARARDTAVHVVHVYYLPPSIAPYASLGEDDSALVDEARDTARATLQRTLEWAGDALDGVMMSSELVAHPSPAQALIDRAGPDDLLVVGSRGHGGFLGLLLGSVSQQCLQHAPCPVAVVREPVAA